MFTCSSSLDSVQDGAFPLYIASFSGHQKCVQLLLEAGAIVDVQNEVSVRVSVVVFIILARCYVVAKVYNGL